MTAQVQITMREVLRKALVLILCSQAVRSTYLASPQLQWTYQLPGSGQVGLRSLKRGNSVQMQGGSLYITADDGSLHIVPASGNFEGAVTFLPESIPGSSMEGRSGVSFGLDFAVYAVQDTVLALQVPYDGFSDANVFSAREVTTSRVIAVNSDGTFRWSVEIDGYIVGTPAVGQDGDKIYVIHNVRTATDQLAGRITVLSDNAGLVVVAAASLTGNEEAPYAPLALAVSQSGTSAPGDVVVWAESWNDGYTERGNVYALVPSTQYDTLNGVGAGAYEVRILSPFTRSTVTRPWLSPDLGGLWIGGTSSTMAGWVDISSVQNLLDGDFVFGPTWEEELLGTERNQTQPFLNAPAVSSDGGLMYITGTSYDLFCLNAQTGNKVWEDFLGRSGYMVEPKLFEPRTDSDGDVVYIIEAITGNVRQHDAANGQRNWGFDCSDWTGVTGCQDGVEAEFSISDDGNVLYYGDIYGRVNALQVADFQTPEPSSVPSIVPSEGNSETPSESGSVLPSSMPSITPSFVQSSAPSDDPSSEPSSIIDTRAPSVTTGSPSISPSLLRTQVPTQSPSQSPSALPSFLTTQIPTEEEEKDETTNVPSAKSVGGDNFDASSNPTSTSGTGTGGDSGSDSDGDTSGETTGDGSSGSAETGETGTENTSDDNNEGGDNGGGFNGDNDGGSDSGGSGERGENSEINGGSSGDNGIGEETFGDDIFGSQSNSAEGGDGGSDQRSMILVAILVAVSVVCCVVAACFILMVRNKKKRDLEDSVLLEASKVKAAERKWQEQQQQYEEACLQNEHEILTEIGAATPPPKVPQGADGTPATLASIEEETIGREEEDEETIEITLEGGIKLQRVDSDDYSLEADSSAAQHAMEEPEIRKKVEKNTGYLPRSLAHYFDEAETPKVDAGGDLGDVPPVEDTVRPRPATEETADNLARAALAVAMDGSVPPKNSSSGSGEGRNDSSVKKAGSFDSLYAENSVSGVASNGSVGDIPMRDVARDDTSCDGASTGKSIGSASLYNEDDVSAGGNSRADLSANSGYRPFDEAPDDESSVGAAILGMLGVATTKTNQKAIPDVVEEKKEDTSLGETKTSYKGSGFPHDEFPDDEAPHGPKL